MPAAAQLPATVRRRAPSARGAVLAHRARTYSLEDDEETTAASPPAAAQRSPQRRRGSHGQAVAAPPPGRQPGQTTHGVSLRAVATTVVGHVKFKKRKSASGIDGARTELSFQRPTMRRRSTVKTLVCRVRMCMPKFGEVQFPSGLMTRFCIVGPNAEPERFFEMVIRSPEVWDLEPPRLILSIMGGAGGMNIDPAVEAHFCEGLVGAAKQTGGWVITGGTDSGVMDLVGKAMHKHDSRRTVPCIGIAPFGAMKEKWRCSLEAVEEDCVVDAAEPLRTTVLHQDLQIVEAPTIRKEDMTGADAKLAGLQQHHTHCVLVDSGKRGTEAFGSEVDVRENLEQFVASGIFAVHGTHSPKGKDKTKILRVMILVNGGPVSFKAMYKAIEHNCPVVVCYGSGRAADFVAALKLGRETDYKEAWTKHMTAPQDRSDGLQGCLEKVGMPDGEEALKRIVQSSCLTVYTIEDRMEDVILEAVLQYIFAQGLLPETLGAQLKRSLELAVQWRCVKHYSRIGRKLVSTCGLQSTIQWILGHFAKEWREVDGGPLMRWLLDTHYEGVKRCPLQQLSPPGLHWTGMQLGIKAEEQSSLAHLFLWLVENRAPTSVVDAVWLQLEYPAHGGLAAAHCYRQTAERLQSKGGYDDALASQRLFNQADRYEDMAIRVLKGLDRVDPLEYLFRRSSRFGNHHLIFLAHHLHCKEFVSQQFYNSAVDILWATPTPFAVFAFDRDRENRRQNLITMSYWDLITGAHLWRRERVSLRDLYSVPRIKAFTHGLSRVLFIVTYSYFVLFAVGPVLQLLSALLFVWGVSLALVEVLQCQAKSSFREYITMWNILDIILLVLLFGALIASWTIVPMGVLRYEAVHAVHALNLLPCYVRLLQIFELSEYFGTLLFTVFGMAQDTLHFLVLLGIISLGFSCSLTPILYPSAELRWDKGVSWGFWAIFGDVELEGGEKNLPWISKMCIGFLQYMLSLTTNVLLVNLLIAMLNDTYIANKDASKREWAFNRVDAVLEFSSPEAHILPPPLDLFVSLQSLRGASHPVSRRDAGRCCTIIRVVPLGPHEVAVHFELAGGDVDAAPDSILAWKEDSLSAEDFTVDGGCEAQEPPVRTRGKLVYSNIPLTKPLQFTYGGKDLGYSAVRLALDEDTWTRSLTRLERRQISVLQHQILVDVEAGEEKLEEKNEAMMAEVDQKLTICTEELRAIAQQVAGLASEKRGDAARAETLRREQEAQNEALRAEVLQLRARLGEAPENPEAGAG